MRQCPRSSRPAFKGEGCKDFTRHLLRRVATSKNRRVKKGDTTPTSIILLSVLMMMMMMMAYLNHTSTIIHL